MIVVSHRHTATGGPTDRMSDRQTRAVASPRYCVASRGKNEVKELRSIDQHKAT